MSRFVGRIATLSCQKNGGPDSNFLIDSLGFSFLHRETGGPFNSIKVVSKKHVPGIEKENARLVPKGLSPHVLWAGGEIRTINGETQLVDTGFMEGSIMPATPKKKPPETRIEASEISETTAGTLRAKSLQGVIVRIDNVTVDEISPPDEKDRRKFIFHDQSGSHLSGLFLGQVMQDIKAGQKYASIRGIVHQPRENQYEVIVEMDDHLCN